MLEIIVYQDKPVISISSVEFCLRLYVYYDIKWRWGQAIGRETVYYTRPLRIIYLLMAGRKPIFSKTVRHIWPWNSQPWLFYIIILYLFSNTFYLLSIVYYLLSKYVIYLLSKSVIYCLLSIIYIYHLLSRLHCSQLLILSLGRCDATFVFLWLLKTWKLLLLIIS